MVSDFQNAGNDNAMNAQNGFSIFIYFVYSWQLFLARWFVSLS
jgi:hypothetical protein